MKRTIPNKHRYFLILVIIAILFRVIPGFSESSAGGYLYEATDEGVTITGYEGTDTRLILPSIIDGQPVTGVQSLGIQPDVEFIVIPDDIRIIGNPFGTCYALKRFEVSEAHPDLCLVDQVLFSRDRERLICYPSELENDHYTIPNWTRIVGKEAFCDCAFLKTIHIPDSVEIIEQGAFCLCTGLEELEIPSSVVSLGQGTFSNSGLSRMDLSSCTGIKELPDRLFYGCWKLKDVTLPPTAESIGNEAFAYSGLETLCFPATASILQIGTDAFKGCRPFRILRMQNETDTFTVPITNRNKTSVR